jgi:hypothetical protein
MAEGRFEYDSRQTIEQGLCRSFSPVVDRDPGIFADSNRQPLPLAFYASLSLGDNQIDIKMVAAAWPARVNGDKGAAHERTIENWYPGAFLARREGGDRS